MKTEPILSTKCYRYGPTTLPSIVRASDLLITPPLHGFMGVVLYFPVPPLKILFNPIQGGVHLSDSMCGVPGLI